VHGIVGLFLFGLAQTTSMSHLWAASTKLDKSQAAVTQAPSPIPSDPIILSADLLHAARTGMDVTRIQVELARLPWKDLLQALHADTQRKVFWINLYNAFNLLQLFAQPAHTKQEKAKHFFGRGIFVAGRRFSLNDIEHRLLRRSRRWWGRGRFQRWLPPLWERQLRVDRLDARVHFALNCGAVSCRPIRFYTTAELDAQLDLATIGYLQHEITYTEDGIFRLPGLFRMYEYDFGGRRGLLHWLANYRPDLPPAKALVFSRFDGHPLLNNFAD
jgi:hypothetical protein